MRVLLVDGESNAHVNELSMNLSNRRVNVETANSPERGVQLATEHNYGAIVLDRAGQVAEVIKQIRASNGTPIVVLRREGDAQEAVNYLETGADDVLTEPVDVDELVARLRSLTRRCEPGDRKVLKIDDLELFPKELVVKRKGQTILLTNREFELLEFMMTNHDRVLTRTELADNVWGAEVEWNSNVIDVSIGRLRGKIHLPGMKPLVHTVTGRGYMISDMPPAAEAK